MKGYELWKEISTRVKIASYTVSKTILVVHLGIKQSLITAISLASCLTLTKTALTASILRKAITMSDIWELSSENLRSIAELIDEIEKRDNTPISNGEISVHIKYEVCWSDSCELIAEYNTINHGLEIQTK